VVDARSLRCEHVIGPLGVDARQPLLSWVPESYVRGQEQTAYEVLVASSPELLGRGIGDRWSSGRVVSDSCEGVRYEGTALESRDRCWWKVRLWDRAGESGVWSAYAVFEMGLLDPADWDGQWIGTDARVSSPLLRTELQLASPIRRARAYVCGLGYYELYINEAKVGDHVLDPVSTNYHADLTVPHGDQLRQRVFYVTYDVTDRLRAGANAIGLMLGHGWYSGEADATPHVDWQGHDAFGDRPRAIMQLEVEYDSGERQVVATAPTWRVAAGPITYNDYAHGERYDARLEQPGWTRPGFDASAWTSAIVLEAPSGALCSQLMAPARVVETLASIGVTHHPAGVSVVDFGQSITGWTRIRVSGPRGAQIRLRHAQHIDEQGELDDSRNMHHEGSEARQTDYYVLSDDGSEVWEPRFTLHGFRYVEITATEPFTLYAAEARVVHSAVRQSGSFSCSEELLNQIHRNACWTFRASFQGFPQDAPERGERVGWLGDPGFVIEDVLYNYDTLQFWSKWLEDIRECQWPDGNVPIIAPCHWRWPGAYALKIGFSDWKAAYPLIVWWLYRFYGVRAVLEEHYEGMGLLLEWIEARSEDLVVPDGLGDHGAPARPHVRRGA
jgi:alpha-L-rhamnosidase